MRAKQDLLKDKHFRLGKTERGSLMASLRQRLRKLRKAKDMTRRTFTRILFESVERLRLRREESQTCDPKRGTLEAAGFPRIYPAVDKSIQLGC